VISCWKATFELYDRLQTGKTGYSFGKKCHGTRSSYCNNSSTMQQRWANVCGRYTLTCVQWLYWHSIHCSQAAAGTASTCCCCCWCSNYSWMELILDRYSPTCSLFLSPIISLKSHGSEDANRSARPMTVGSGRYSCAAVRYCDVCCVIAGRLVAHLLWSSTINCTYTYL